MDEKKVFAIYAHTRECGHDCEMLVKALDEKKAIAKAKKAGCNANHGYRGVHARELNGVSIETDIVIVDPFFD